MLITNNHVSFARKGKIAQISKKSQNIMVIIVVGLALFSTLKTHSAAELETLPHFVVIKAVLKVLAIKL